MCLPKVDIFLVISFLYLSSGYVVCQTCFGSKPGKQLIATSTKQFITSPGFPNNYTNNLNCFWEIVDTGSCGLIRFDVVFANLEWAFDTVRLMYGSSTEIITNSSVHVIPSYNVSVWFKTDDSIVGKGFNMSYVAADCICVKTSDIDVVANSTTQYLASPGWPYRYPLNIQCRWNVTLPTTCSLLRMEVILIDIADGSDNFTLEYDDGHLNLKSKHVYHILSQSIVLRFQSDSSTSGRGFNISYQALDLRVTTNSSVFGCQDSPLLAEEQSKYIYSSNYPEYSRDTFCEWMIFVAEPCMVSSKGNNRTLTIVVEDFKSNGSTTIAISQAPSRDPKQVDISQESLLVGHTLYFHVPLEEFILIAVRHSNDSSAFKISYKVAHTGGTTVESSQPIVLIASAAAVCAVLLISVIALVLICHICRKRTLHRMPVSTIEMQTKEKERKGRPYVNMDKLDNSEIGVQREPTADEIYEVVDDEPGVEDTTGQEYYMDMSGPDRVHVAEIYENTDIIGGVPRPESSDSDGENYEEMREYTNTSKYSKRK